MTDEKKAPAEKPDPTMGSESVWTGDAEGQHDLHPLEEQTWAAVNKEYREMPDDMKPHSSTVANLEIRPDEK